MSIKLNTREIKVLALESSFQSLKFIIDILEKQKEINFADDFVSYELAFERIEDKNFNINYLHNNHPDILLIDCSISTTIKDEICAFVRAYYKNRHIGLIFVCTSNKDEDVALDYLEKGADDYFKYNASSKEIQARFKAVLRLKLTTDKLRKANFHLKELSRTDDLTGLYNMRAFNSYYASAIKECKDNLTPFSIIMLDLDNFKLVNDIINHLMGSHIIKEVGKLIKNSSVLSDKDIAARYGGDEYIILTFDDSVENAKSKALGLKKLIAESLFIKDNKAVQITTSVGLCWIPKGFYGNEEDPIKGADMMLYKSKNSGRNKLHIMQAVPQVFKAEPNYYEQKYIFVEVPIEDDEDNTAANEATPRFFSL